MNAYDKQRGFVLITSLIFLVVVTLLAVSAINRSTLQEKIAANTRARETATQHANAALRAAEAVLSTAVFDTYQAAGTDVTLVEDLQKGIPKKVHIWRENAIPDMDDTQELDPGEKDILTAQDFLETDVWDGSKPEPYKALQNVEYFIEELADCYQANLDPDSRADGCSVIIYRITARATQGNATVVTQSTFAKYY